RCDAGATTRTSPSSAAASASASRPGANTPSSLVRRSFIRGRQERALSNAELVTDSSPRPGGWRVLGAAGGRGPGGARAGGGGAPPGGGLGLAQARGGCAPARGRRGYQ